MSDHAPRGGARDDRAHAEPPSSELLRRGWDEADSAPAAHWPEWTDRQRYTITRQLGRRREGSR